MHHQKDLYNMFYDKQGNIGLLYYKFTPIFVNDENERRKKQKEMKEKGIYYYIEEKKEWLKNFIRLQSNNTVLQKRIHALKEYKDLYIVLENETRFLCGIGYVNTIEWGLSFDWTTGIPYLPGSSFKGVLLSYLEFVNGNPVEKWKDEDKAVLECGEKWSKNDIISVFGPQGSEKSQLNDKNTGSVVFFAVYPEMFNGFELDIITPHFSQYYTDPKNNRPADIYSPVPSHFLTVKPGSKFAFMCKMRKNCPIEIEKLEKLIIEAAENYGFGAKTASGYGYFKKAQKSKKQKDTEKDIQEHTKTTRKNGNAWDTKIDELRKHFGKK